MSDLDDALDAYDPGPRARMCGDGKRADSYDRARAELAALRERVAELETRVRVGRTVTCPDCRGEEVEACKLCEGFGSVDSETVRLARDCDTIRWKTAEERVAKLEAVETAAFQLTRWDSDHLIEPGPRGDQLVILIRALDKVVRAARESTQ